MNPEGGGTSRARSKHRVYRQSHSKRRSEATGDANHPEAVIMRAMTPFEAFVLALLQGVTEFLPISSSAHLILVPYILEWKDHSLTFDVVSNAGTLLAAMVYFRKDLARTLLNLGPRMGPRGRHLARPRARCIVAGAVGSSWPGRCG